MSNDPDLIDSTEECPYCSGTGMWAETIEANTDEDYLSEDPCPECDGEGVVDL